MYNLALVGVLVFRLVLRVLVFHLVLGVLVSILFYLPFHEDIPQMRFLFQWIIIPLLSSAVAQFRKYKSPRMKRYLSKSAGCLKP